MQLRSVRGKLMGKTRNELIGAGEPGSRGAGEPGVEWGRGGISKKKA